MFKIIFNLDLSGPAHEVVFSRKQNNVDHPDIHFNDVKVEVSSRKTEFQISY